MAERPRWGRGGLAQPPRPGAPWGLGCSSGERGLDFLASPNPGRHSAGGFLISGRGRLQGSPQASDLGSAASVCAPVRLLRLPSLAHVFRRHAANLGPYRPPPRGECRWERHPLPCPPLSSGQGASTAEIGSGPPGPNVLSSGISPSSGLPRGQIQKGSSNSSSKGPVSGPLSRVCKVRARTLGSDSLA